MGWGLWWPARLRCSRARKTAPPLPRIFPVEFTEWSLSSGISNAFPCARRSVQDPLWCASTSGGRARLRTWSARVCLNHVFRFFLRGIWRIKMESDGCHWDSLPSPQLRESGGSFCLACWFSGPSFCALHACTGHTRSHTRSREEMKVHSYSVSKCIRFKVRR